MNLKKMFPIVAMLLIVFIAGCKKKEDNPGVRQTVNSTSRKNLEYIDSSLIVIISAVIEDSGQHLSLQRPESIRETH